MNRSIISYHNSTMIKYSFDLAMADDLASLGVEFFSNDDELIVYAPWSHPLTNDLKINANCYQRQ